MILNKDLYPELRYISTERQTAIVGDEELLKQKYFPLCIAVDKNPWSIDDQNNVTKSNENVV